MKIQKANASHHEILTELTKKSKAFWGYSNEQIQKWILNLTVTKEYIETNNTFNLIYKNEIIGYYSYIVENNLKIKLDNLFIEPKSIRKGFGKYLINDFITRIRKENFTIIVLNAEPNAENFYIKMGFKKISSFETSIKNRFMPIMELKL